MLKFTFMFVVIAFLWNPTQSNPANDENTYLIAKYGLINKPTRSLGETARHPNEVGRQVINSLWDIIADPTRPILGSVWTNSVPSATTLKPKPGFTVCELECHKFVTPEYDPQCGNDGLTYTNTGRVECAKRCGKDVKLRRGACDPMTLEPITFN